MTVSKATDAILTKSGLVKQVWDFTLDDSGDINTDDFFDTAILMSLFAEKRATSSEVPDSVKRRGWIGNESNDDNFEIGSKIWLYEQARLDSDTLNGIKSAALDGLNWFIKRGYAVNFAADVALISGIVTLQIDIFRPNSPVDRRFFDLWSASGITSSET